MNFQLKNLKDQVIVITGASSGIGLVTARMAAKRGARVVLNARNEEALRRVTNEINAEGGNACHAAPTDHRFTNRGTRLRRMGRMAFVVSELWAIVTLKRRKAQKENAMHDDNQDENILKGIVAGLAGGFVASWTMNQFQAGWTRMAGNSEKSHGAQSMQPSEGSKGDQAHDAKEQDDATVETAKVISKNVFGHELKESEKEPAGAVVHYAFGTATGGLYGALAEVSPQVTMGAGLPFGAAFWLIADEVAVPVLGLSKGPTEYPVSTHAYALASHLVYGVTAEFTRRALRQVL